jgi:hypothetical protein
MRKPRGELAEDLANGGVAVGKFRAIRGSGNDTDQGFRTTI